MAEAKGSVTFASGAPDVSPIITHDPLTEKDKKVAAEAVAVAMKIGKSSALGGTFIDNGAGESNAWSAVYDGRGSCRMGSSSEDSVVNGNLKVHGIRRLRIVDGSVIPVGGPYLAVPEVLALAERGAHIILQDHGDERTVDSQSKEVEDIGGAISIESLTKELGEGFTLFQAVDYLAGVKKVTQTEVLAALSDALFATG